MPDLTIAQFLEALAVRSIPDNSAHWDPTGLQLGDSRAPARRVAVCHEVTDAVAGKLEAEPPDLVVTYHPLLFRPTQHLTAGPGPVGRAYRLVRAGVAVAVAHTDFDVAPGGAADSLANALGLQHCRGFGPLETASATKIVTFLPPEAVETMAVALELAGAGRIGRYRGCSFRSTGEGAFFAGAGTEPAVGGSGANRVAEVRLEMIAPVAHEQEVVAALVAHHPYDQPAYDLYPIRANLPLIGRVGHLPAVLPFDEFVALVSDVLGSAGLRSTQAVGAVNRVAVAPGAGSDFIRAARSTGADAFVTGDVAHHRAAEARDLGLSIVDPGHAATEGPGMATLVSWVGEIVSNLDDLTYLMKEQP